MTRARVETRQNPRAIPTHKYRWTRRGLAVACQPRLDAEVAFEAMRIGLATYYWHVVTCKYCLESAW